MNKFFIIILLLFSQTNKLISQTLDDLFYTLEIPQGWEKKISRDSSFNSFYNNGKIAKISLTNEFRVIEIILFEKSVLNNTDFLKAEEEYDHNNSCRNFNTSARYRIFSFTSPRFYIVPNLCPKCDFEKDKKCKKIQKYYHQWASKWAVF